jgi:hypothetical protein
MMFPSLSGLAPLASPGPSSLGDLAVLELKLSHLQQIFSAVARQLKEDEQYAPASCGR